MSLTPVAPFYYPPSLTLTPANSGEIITTQWSGQPVIPTNLPSGFQCTIINYSGTKYTSCVLNQPMFVTTGMVWNQGTASFTLEPGQCCVLTVAPCYNGVLGYFVSKG